MASVEEFREKEKEYQLYGFFISKLKREIKEDLETWINSGIDDSQKKLSGLYPQKDINQSIEKMRNSYLSAVEKHSSEMDAAIDEVLKLPQSPLPELSDVDEKMNLEIDGLKMKLLALNKYHSELVKTEQELLEDDILDFSEQSDLLMKMEASSLQWRSEMSLMADLFSKRASGTVELENSVMNMSIG